MRGPERSVKKLGKLVIFCPQKPRKKNEGGGQTKVGVGNVLGLPHANGVRHSEKFKQVRNLKRKKGGGLPASVVLRGQK